jgi:hypothetical protein
LLENAPGEILIVRPSRKPRENPAPHRLLRRALEQNPDTSASSSADSRPAGDGRPASPPLAKPGRR